MDPIERRILLKRARVKIIALAKQHNVTDSFIHQILDDQRSTQWMREAIAKAAKKPVEKLWPTYKRPHRAERIVHNNSQRKAA